MLMIQVSCAKKVWLKALERPFNVISLDCTEANRPIVPYIGHLNFNKCAAIRDEFIKDGIANDKTIFVLNHFSHNGINVIYDEFEKIVRDKGFVTSYDGLIIEY